MSSRVSAIILTYNRLPYLKQAVASARWQTYGDLEIVVVANGSDAQTVRWLESLDDPRLTLVVLPENISPPQARNEGLRKASGRWIAHLDDDDVWAPDKVEAMMAAMAEGRAWAYCGVVYIDHEGLPLAGRGLPPPQQVEDRLPVAYTIPGGLSGLMYDREQLPDGGEIDALPYTGDWDLALRLLQVGSGAPVNRPLVGFRQHAVSWSGTVADDLHEFAYVVDKHASQRGSRRAQWGEHYRYVASHAARAGARGPAVRLYGKAIAHGDLRSVPRLIGACLPEGLQLALRRVVLSDREWVEEASHWLAALRTMR